MTTATHDELDELLAFLDPQERATLERDLRAIAPKPKGRPVPHDWRLRVPMVFPRYASAPFAARHEQFWTWVNGIELESSPRPFCAFWPRGGAKSTSAEMAVADLGCRRKRRYCLYVRMTQDKADASVENVAALLESDEVARHYPEHAKRKVGKFGNAKGWRRNRVWTHGGFAVDALGLDTASRGVKLEEQRPDLIVFDDIDDLMDGPAQTKKKIDTITKSILPAGANNVAVLFIQNLIIRDGVASQLADSRADFLADRIVSGPFPAVDGLRVDWKLDPTTGTRRATIVAGRASWAGQPIDACQAFIDRWGLSAFMKEAQHKVQGRSEGVCLRFDASRHYVNPDLTADQWRELVAKSKAFAGVDPQWWRFGFTLWIVTPENKVIRLDEFFSQQETLNVRARRIHEMCVRNGIKDPAPKSCPIWADAANPQDIQELNLAFRTGWVDNDGQHVTSKLRVVAVGHEAKLRRVAVQRINNMLDRNLLLFRRNVGTETPWYLGQNAGSPGTEMRCSRFIWEIENWAVPVPKEGEAQDENPDDDTADGADCIASGRYALMSWWKASAPPAEAETYENDRAWPFDPKQQKFKEPPHVADLFETRSRRRPSVRGVRPRIPR